MQQAFITHLHLKQWFKPADRLLLAISGGVDSVVLAHLLKKNDFHFSLAHCNFNLRGKDSRADETFCRKLAKQLSVPLFVKQLDAAGFAKKNKVSIQMAARELRYTWFEELMEEQKADFLLTAHNAGDVVETLFINLLRGTGIKGLKGIPEKTGRIVRPLLVFSKSQILDYAQANAIAYRTDKSNLEPKYERNFLRLKVFPLLKKMHPSLEQVLLNNIRNFNEEANLVEEALAERSKGLADHRQGFVYLDKTRLKKDPYCRSLLHYLLGPFGFNTSQLADLEEHLRRNGLVGKMLFSSSHTLTIDRKHLVIRENKVSNSGEIKLSSLKELGTHPLFSLSRIKSFKIPSAGELIVENSRLIFPLSLRGKVKGDKFKPYGMSGFKLLSDFLKDQKLNNFEKENCKLLVNGNGDIIWVLGYRSDDRYKVTDKSRDLIKLKLID